MPATSCAPGPDEPHPGQRHRPVDQVKADTERDYFATAGKGQGLWAGGPGDLSVGQPSGLPGQRFPQETPFFFVIILSSLSWALLPWPIKKAPPAKERLYCSFCGKSQHGVKLIAGPSVFICDECIDLLQREIIRDEQPTG